jgi:hypothetical protein
MEEGARVVGKADGREMWERVVARRGRGAEAGLGVFWEVERNRGRAMAEQEERLVAVLQDMEPYS